MPNEHPTSTPEAPSLHPLLAPDRFAFAPLEVAQVLGLGRNATYDAIQRGDIPSVRIGGRIIVPRQALMSLLEAASATGEE